MKCFRLRCYVNNSFLVFHQGTKHSKTIKHSRFALVFHTVFSCLDPLMKHSNSLFTYNMKFINCTISTPLMTLEKSSRAQELLAELIATRAYTIFAALFDTRDRARKILSCLIILSTRGKDRTVCEL